MIAKLLYCLLAFASNKTFASKNNPVVRPKRADKVPATMTALAVELRSKISRESLLAPQGPLDAASNLHQSGNLC
jgi:hypothetical protein